MLGINDNGDGSLSGSVICLLDTFLITHANNLRPYAVYSTSCIVTCWERFPVTLSSSKQVSLRWTGSASPHSHGWVASWCRLHIFTWLLLIFAFTLPGQLAPRSVTTTKSASIWLQLSSEHHTLSDRTDSISGASMFEVSCRTVKAALPSVRKKRSRCDPTYKISDAISLSV